MIITFIVNNFYYKFFYVNFYCYIYLNKKKYETTRTYRYF